MIALLVLAAALARAEFVEPVKEEVEPLPDSEHSLAEPPQTVAQQWSEVYRLLDEFKASNTDSGPVAVYDIESDNKKLPSKIFIAAYATHKSILVGLLGVLEKDWAKRYWVADKDEATAAIAKAMKVEPKDKEGLAEVRRRIDAEMGSSYFLVYRIMKPPQEESEVIAPLKDGKSGGPGEGGAAPPPPAPPDKAPRRP